jgi:hypothetical protein
MLQHSVRHEFFQVHKYIQVTCSPLGIGGGLVPTCNGAKNDMWP